MGSHTHHTSCPRPAAPDYLVSVNKILLKEQKQQRLLSHSQMIHRAMRTLAGLGAISGQSWNTGRRIYSAAVMAPSAVPMGRTSIRCDHRYTKAIAFPHASLMYVYVDPDLGMRVPRTVEAHE